MPITPYQTPSNTQVASSPLLVAVQHYLQLEKPSNTAVSQVISSTSSSGNKHTLLLPPYATPSRQLNPQELVNFQQIQAPIAQQVPLCHATSADQMQHDISINSTIFHDIQEQQQQRLINHDINAKPTQQPIERKAIVDHENDYIAQGVLFYYERFGTRHLPQSLIDEYGHLFKKELK